MMKSRPTLGVNEHTESRYIVNSTQFTNEEKLPRNILVASNTPKGVIGSETENNKMNMICVMPIIGRHGLHIHVLRRIQEQQHRPRQVPSEFCLGPRNHAITERFSRGTSPVDWPGFSLDPATVSAVLHNGKVQGTHSYDSFREGRNSKGKFENISFTFSYISVL